MPNTSLCKIFKEKIEIMVIKNKKLKGKRYTPDYNVFRPP